ncbi:pyridoxamine 5'-phosphate oxidase family protein [Paractinoplanes lichenicola]|nr:pyridoxamine 5'-phosphate oxidase family protein [Actinoplanes lichenicola]
MDAVLTGAQIFWLSTVRADGRPHVTPLPAVWTAGSLHFCTGPLEQKAKNLEANPNVVLTTGTDKQDEGLDVVVEGQAVRVTDGDRLRALAQLWKERLNWDYKVSGEAFTQLDEQHDAYVFGVAPAKVLAFGKGEPYSQTRFRFPTS